MQLTINGEQKQFPAPLTIREMLTQLGLEARKIAVEHNLEIIPHSSYASVTLKEGDSLEIVHFIGGGKNG